MAAAPKPLHPEILYAERSSETDAEKVRFAARIRAWLVGSTSTSWISISFHETQQLTTHRRTSSTSPSVGITDPSVSLPILTNPDVPDINGEPRLDITKDQISFAATSGTPDKGIPTKDWAFDLTLWGEIVPEDTKKSVHGRGIVLVLRKKELRAEYWPRLTKEKP